MQVGAGTRRECKLCWYVSDPALGDAIWPVAPGESAAFDFPAGRTALIAAREAHSGEYLACSLLSPMFEFADHDTAPQTAVDGLAALLDAGTAALPSTALRKREILRGRRCGKRRMTALARCGARSTRERST